MSYRPNEQQLQEDNLISKIDNMQNYLKQVGLHMSAIIKDANVRDFLKHIIDNFDKSVEEYNAEYLHNRFINLIYFKIQMLALSRDQPVFVEEVHCRDRNMKLPYFAKLIFVRQTELEEPIKDDGPRFGKSISFKILAERNYYRMHVELYKKGEFTEQTNTILSCYEKICMTELLQALTDKGYINFQQGLAVYVKTKKPAYKSFNKVIQNSLIQTLKLIVQKFLKMVSIILISNQVCSYCNRHMAFQPRFNIVMPPTVFMPSKQRIKDDEKQYKKFHEACAVRYMRPVNPIPPQYKNVERSNRSSSS